MSRDLARSSCVRFVASFFLLLGAAQADDLPRAAPEELGLSASRLAYVDRFYADKVSRGEIAGIVLLVARHGKIAHFSAIGAADVTSGRKMQTDTIFRLYSMTKPIAAAALMMLYEEGRFQMHDPLSKYLPELAGLRVLRTPEAAIDDTVPLERAPTVQDVLRHTAGLSHGYLKNAVDAAYLEENVFGVDVSLEQIVSKLAKIPLLEQPGRKFIYSIGPDVHARLVEVISGMPFDQFLERRVFRPLGMKDTGFWLTPDKAQRLATVHWLKAGKLAPLDEAHGYPGGDVLAEPWSVNSYTKNHRRKGGSYGLVATAEDYWRFAQTILNRGVLGNARILSPQVVRYMARDHWSIDTPEGRPSGTGFGLGFGVMKDPAAAGYMSSEGTLFWGGAAETFFWIDPKEDLIVVALSQHMGSADAQFMANWAELRTLFYSALVE